MNAVRDALTQKVGPLPAWAWGVGLGAGIAGLRAYRARNADASAPVVESDGSPPEPDASAALTPEPGAYTPGVTGAWPVPGTYTPAFPGVLPEQPAPSAPQSPTTGSTAPTTNGAWRQLAYDSLVGSGAYAPLAVDQALGAYLNGDPVTAVQEAIISAALRRVGPPPEGAPQITRAAPAPVVAPSAPIAPPATIPTPSPAAPATPAPAAGPAEPPTRPTLSEGSTGPAVARLQSWLTANAGAAITADGTFGPATRRAVENFQRFMEGGQVRTGRPGVVDAHWYGVIDYVSSLKGVASI